MSGLPPLPPGFTVEENPDPWTILKAEGFQATNGYRTKRDVEAIRAQGYKPAADGAHNRGDGVDLIHPKLSPKQQAIRLRELSKQHGWKDAVVLDEGHHRHFAIPGWGKAPGTPGTPNSGLPPLPDGFTLEQRGSLKGTPLPTPSQRRKPALPIPSPGVATGEVVDGDTFKLSSGRNARLFGVDAWELQQKGRERNGALVALGGDARQFFDSHVTPALPVNFTNGQSYGRPVASLGSGGVDPGREMLRHGHALAAPQYLQDDPRFGPYMEAERLARQNLLGGHGTNAETPEQFRHKDGPWQGAEPGEWGKGQAIFGDEATPFMGLRPEIERAYLAITVDPKSTADDILAFAKEHGFNLSAKEVRHFVNERNKGAKITSAIRYAEPPAPLTDTGHGAAGAIGRGVADPINFVDEIGGVAQSLGLPSANGPRENVWNSDRRFGDILWNNIDQNRSILAYDQEHHPVARFGGQLGSGLLIPYGAGARTVGQLTRLGAVEGGLAGMGAGEGTIVDRLDDAAAGTIIGAATGNLLGRVADDFRNLHEFGPKGAVLGRESRLSEATYEAAPILNDGAQNAGPTPASKSQPQGGALAAMRADDLNPALVGPAPREPDVIDVANLPPLPNGFVLEEPTLGRTPKMGERASAEAIAAAARKIAPEDVEPLPSNRVESLEEWERANPGTLRELEAPDEFAELAVRRLPSHKDLFRWRTVRGPLDITQWLRAEGGVRDDGGDLAHMGIDNKPRRMSFGSNEQFLGRLVSDEGMSLDDAGERLWEAGYFTERPTVAEVLDALHQEHTGATRFFLPDEMEEVARFESAQAERYRIEEARDEGSPLAEQIGTPVTLADLEANRPPATAYEDLGKLGGKAGNIDLARLETKDDIGRLLNVTGSRFGGFDAARRGEHSWAETEALASELKMKADDLLKRRQGQALNAEQALQARRILAKSGEEVVSLAKRVKGGSDEDVASFHRAMIRHAAIQEQVTGATAEAGRALQAFKIAAKAKDHRERILKSVIEGAGGKHRLEDLADIILEAQRDPSKLNRFIADAAKPTWKDKAVELWYNSLLSGPQTHAVNILSNALTAGLQLPEHLAAAAGGKVRQLTSKALGGNEVDRVLLSEIGPRTVGLMQGAREGVRAFRHTLRTGDVADHVTKVESARQEAISGLKGKVLRVPTRLLSAEDEFFKATGRRMEIAGLAVRMARSEGLKGEKLQARIAELTANPTDEMIQKSMDYARYLTFQRPLGPAMQNVMAITQKHPWLKLFVPFIRTPTNILKFAVERSPAAPVLREVRDSLKAGGAARDLAVARVALGTGLGLMVAQWTADGTITGGGPADDNARRLMMADGWQPYSIRIGDKYYSYRRLDPLATTLGVAADMVDLQSAMTERQREEVPALIIASVLQNLQNKTWLSGLSDVLAVVEDPQRNSHHFIERLAGSVAVPTLSAQVARTIDPVARETSSEGYAAGILDAIRARIPGLSKGLLPKRDVWGEPIANEGGIGPDLASPVWTSTAQNDPALQQALIHGARIGPLNRNVAGGRLPDDLFNQYQAIAGQLTKQYIQQEIAAPEWKRLTPAQRKKAIEDARDDARKDARDALMQFQGR